MNIPTAPTSGPAVEPITLADAKAHLRVTTTTTTDVDSVYINGLITVARKKVESYLNRKLVWQMWDIYWDRWPAGDYITLPFGNLKTVTSVKYTDSDSTQSTLSSTKYTVDIYSNEGRVVLVGGNSWPSDNLFEANPITIKFKCGFSSSRANIPEPIKHAVKVELSGLYEQREPDIVGVGFQWTRTRTVQQLLSDYRNFKF